MLLIIAVSSYVSTSSGIQHNHDSTILLGICSALFSALAYLLLEDSIPTATDMPVSSTRKSIAGEFWSSCILLGRDLGICLLIGFGGATVLVEDTFSTSWQWYGRGFSGATLYSSGVDWPVVLKIGGAGFLGAVRWIMIPALVSSLSVVSVTFVDLGPALLSVLFSAFEAGRIVMFFTAVGGMCFFYGQGVSTKGLEKQGISRTRLMHLTLLLLLSGTIAWAYVFSNSIKTETWVAEQRLVPGAPAAASSIHPIARLIAEAEMNHIGRLSRQSKTLQDAVKEYQRRYHMNPPPNFDRWYKYAKKRNVVLFDEYDTIFHSMQPFWGMAPSEIRKRAREAMGFRDDFIMSDNKLLHAYVRNGAVRVGGQGPDWQKEATEGILRQFSEFLPDMDLAFNIHDEPRVVVPHDILHQYVQKAGSNKFNPQKAVNSYTPMPVEEHQPLVNFSTTSFNVYAHQSIYSHAILSCPPDSPVRNIEKPPDARARFSTEPLGFVINTTSASDICLSPSLQRRHGFLNRPNAFNVAHDLYPVFSQSKASSFGDILYPSPWYWAGRVKYEEAQDIPWAKKSNSLYWRGSTTGGYSRNGGWQNQHRQHVVSTLNDNGTASVLHLPTRDGTWAPRSVPRQSLSLLFDVHFSHVGQCDAVDCDAQKSFFALAPKAKQQDAWKWKFLLDMDGNAFSGRFYAFLRSRSTVFKWAYFREWHDEWLWPWVHYVPLSLDLLEAAEMMRFFTHEPRGKELAKGIADNGRMWAQKVLRNEDLEVWLFRLLLE